MAKQLKVKRGTARRNSSGMRAGKSQEQRKASNLRLFHQEIGRLVAKQVKSEKFWALISSRGQQ